MPSRGEDVARLAAVVLERLRDGLGSPDLTYRRPPKNLAGGKFSSVYAFELHPQPASWTGSFVLRLVGPSERARLEAGLHVAAIAEGLSAPRLLFWEADAPGLGGGYLVMEQVPGRTYLRGVEPWRFAPDLPKLLAAWPRQLPKVIGALARVDPAEAISTLEHHGVPDDLARPGRHLRAVSANLADEPAIAGAIDWLHAHRPSTPECLALVHGDLWPGNVFVRGDEIRLIDWTRGGVDDPALDVGFAKVGFDLMPEPFPPPPPIRELVHRAGSSIARRISAHCDRLVGGPDRVRYYEALRCAVERMSSPSDPPAIDRDGSMEFRPWSAAWRRSPVSPSPSPDRVPGPRASQPPAGGRCPRRWQAVEVLGVPTIGRSPNQLTGHCDEQTRRSGDRGIEPSARKRVRSR